MFTNIKKWDNRKEFSVKGVVRVQPNGRTWTRRIRWLEDGEYRIKLKMEDGKEYREIIVNYGMAHLIWERFKSGQSISDSVSILATDVPQHLASKKAMEGRE